MIGTDYTSSFWNEPDDAIVPLSEIARVLRCSPAKLERDRWQKQGLGAKLFKVDGRVFGRVGTIKDYVARQEKGERHVKTA
jgi:hypothetical protein